MDPKPAATPEPPLPWLLLAAACFAMFVTSCSGNTRAPFLLDMARDLESSLGMVANIMALTSVAWGVSSVVAGAVSDRWGRQPFLIGAPLALGGMMAGIATAPSFLMVAVWATLAGGCGGIITSTLFAEVSARVENRQRGRALGWVMAGQSLTLLVGVPLSAWVGAFLGWRGVNFVVTGLAVLSSMGMLAVTWGRTSSARAVGAAPPSYRAALTPRVLRLLGIGVAERICYGLTAVYFATFLQTTYDLSLAGVALPLAIIALGSIAGTVLGGQLADKLPNRMMTFALAMVASAAAGLALFLWTGNLERSIGLGFLYVFLNAIARPSLLAALANVPDAIRGTVMGLNVTSASFGWLGAASLGGWMMAGWGFAGFGPLTAAIAVLGAVLALGGRK